MPVTRRLFIQAMSVTPMIALGACRRGRPAQVRSCSEERRSGPKIRVFDPQQRASLQAACARLIPTDDEAGATEAGVVDYIDAQLALPHFKVFYKMFLAGLRQMDLLARKRGASSFRECPPEGQDQVLRQLEQGVPLGRRRNSKRFFHVLLAFTLEGFLGDPVYGGNKNEVGWQFIGFQPRPPRPRCPYRSEA